MLVTAAPFIWYLQDTDGGGKADVRRVLLTGFSEGNQQLRVNGLLWGLDNWVYGPTAAATAMCGVRTTRRPRRSPSVR
jgi:hypothetical protein